MLAQRLQAGHSSC